MTLARILRGSLEKMTSDKVFIVRESLRMALLPVD
jgi:hypothetical protein